jgi:hypothetical protein
VTAILAAAMLAAGIGVGAAIGPAPEPSEAGNAASLAARLPLLIRALSAKAPGTASPAAEAGEGGGEEELVPRHRRRRRHHRLTTAAPATAEATAPSSEAGSEPGAGGHPRSSAPRSSVAKLPPVTSVWLIELNGPTFAQASAQAAAAPLLSSWSALDGQALAAEAGAAVPTPLGGTPALLHTIVQPPCPEGDATCASETSGQLTTADQFLQAALAQITGTAAYREHGLVVITFANVGVATQSGLPAGASSATLTTQPPAGVVVMSPFAHPGARPTTRFDTASPVHSLEGLLHR